MVQEKDLQVVIRELQEASSAINSSIKKLIEMVSKSDEEDETKKEKLIIEARAILSTKVTAEAQELIRSYGVQNLSKVKLADFDELITRAKELTDAPS